MTHGRLPGSLIRTRESQTTDTERIDWTRCLPTGEHVINIPVPEMAREELDLPRWGITEVPVAAPDDARMALSFA